MKLPPSCGELLLVSPLIIVTMNSLFLITADEYCRIPNVQTIDDLLVEKCQPGDVILFDRRCECCASGAVAALGCLLGKVFLCDEDDGTRSVERGSYEHCGE